MGLSREDVVWSAVTWQLLTVPRCTLPATLFSFALYTCLAQEAPEALGTRLLLPGIAGKF